MADYVGTSGNDKVDHHLDVSATANDWDFSQGGSDKLIGGAGTDTFYFGSNFNTPSRFGTAQDAVDGGAGTDTLILDGNYTDHAQGNSFAFSALHLTSSSMVSVENLVLDNGSGNNYDITLDAGTVTAGHSLEISTPTPFRNGTFPNYPVMSVHIDASAAQGDVTFDDIYGGTLIGGSDINYFIFEKTNGWSNVTIQGGDNLDYMEVGQLSGGAISGIPPVDFSHMVLGSNISGIEGILLDFSSTQGVTPVAITTTDSVVAAGATFTLVAHAGHMPTSLNTLTFDGTAETNGNFNLIGGTGDDIISTGRGADTIQGAGGNDHLNGGLGADYMGGGAGNDIYTVDNAADKVEEFSNAGSDTVYTSTSFTLARGSFVEWLATTSAAATNAINLVGNEQAQTLNGNNGVNGLLGGGGNDIIYGQGGNDVISGGAGRDVITPGAGNDKLLYSAVSDSTGINRDLVLGMNLSAADKFDFTVKPTSIHAEITHGGLNGVHFDQNLAFAIGAAQLGAHQAVLFDPDAGDLNVAGHVFLVVDANGVAGYQAGHDYVVELTGTTGTLSVDDFL